MKKLFISFLLLAAFIVASSTVFAAGAIKISPVSVDLDQDRTINSLQITNLDKNKAVFQVYTKRWNQVNGQDVFADTDDLIVSPPIFTLLPNQTQILRVALKARPEKIGDEQTYRVFLHQVPIFAPEKKSSLHLIFNISLPVFVAPSGKVFRKLAWQLSTLSHGKFQLTVTNDSNVHALIRQFNLTSINNTIIWRQKDPLYLLPHQTTKFVFTKALAGKQLQVVADTGWGKFTEKLPAV